MPLEPTGGIAAYGYCLQPLRAHNLHQSFHELPGCAFTAQLRRRKNVIDIKRALLSAYIRINGMVPNSHFIAVFGLVKYDFRFHINNI